METIPTPIRKELNPLIIHKKHLFQIYNLLLENCKEIEIISGNVRYDNMDELCSTYGHRRIKDLRITGRYPYLKIELEPMWATVYIEKSDVQCEGIFTKLVSYLTQDSKIFGIISSYKVFFIIIILCNVGVMLFSREGYWLNSLALAPFVIIFLFIRLKNFCSIYPNDADTIEDFWNRNKDSLVVSAISGITGFILGMLFNQFTKQ